MLRSLGISEPATPRLEIARMRRRHLRGVMAIERQAYVRPWSPNLFVAEMTEPNNAPDERREEPKDDHLDVTAQYGGGNDWETAPTGLRAWWRRLRGK